MTNRQRQRHRTAKTPPMMAIKRVRNWYRGLDSKDCSTDKGEMSYSKLIMGIWNTQSKCQINKYHEIKRCSDRASDSEGDHYNSFRF